MGRWLAARVAHALVTLAVAVTLLFFLMRVVPGDPLSRLSDDRPISPREIARLRERYGLDQPIGRQYAAFLTGAARGDLGVSIEFGRPVTRLIAERLPATLLLGGTVLLLNFTLGLWLGVRQAVRQGRATDRWLEVASLAGYSVPSFWLGLLLAWLAATHWRILPSGGMHDVLLERDAGGARIVLDVLRHLALPALTLSLVSIAATMRYQRTAMLEALAFPFVQTARAKGITERRVVWHHAWRNALFPVITLFGLWLPVLVTGSVFVEQVFAWPGLGSLAAGAVGGRDYPLLMGTALLASTLVVAGGLLADLLYALLDPRVRHA
ncbi:MAG TPA: ABC transporter permease [Gemmatimonadales bacterium]|nr:ABC transporter permease [Gemmatimonadales bacterium]